MVSSGVYSIYTRDIRVNSECYMNLLSEGLLPHCLRLYPNKDYIFQQDGATSHTKWATKSYLEGNTNKFNKKDEWLPKWITAFEIPFQRKWTVVGHQFSKRMNQKLKSLRNGKKLVLLKLKGPNNIEKKIKDS